MAMHSIRCGTGYRHCQLNLLWFRERRAHAPNHAAPVPNTTIHAVAGSRASWGTSIPAIAVPMTACSPSASASVASPRSRETPAGLRSSPR